MSMAFEKGGIVEFFRNGPLRHEGHFGMIPNGHPLTIVDVMYKKGKPFSVQVSFEKDIGRYKAGDKTWMGPIFLQQRSGQPVHPGSKVRSGAAPAP